MKALHQLKAKNSFHMWLGDGCGLDAKKRALVNIAAFLGQAMKETIIYDACGEFTMACKCINQSVSLNLI
jgi:hypothetical protein